MKGSVGRALWVPCGCPAAAGVPGDRRLVREVSLQRTEQNPRWTFPPDGPSWLPVASPACPHGQGWWGPGRPARLLKVLLGRRVSDQGEGRLMAAHVGF